MASGVGKDVTPTNNGFGRDDTLSVSDKKKKELDQLLRIVIGRFVRGFSAGLGFHAGYALIKSLFKGSLKNGLLKAWRTTWTKSTMKTATFLGLFPSLYRLALYYLKTSRNVQDDWNYLISGAVAGLSILLLDKNSRQTITFFSVSRAVGAGVPALVTRGDLPYIPHTDIAVFSVCTGIIMYTACCRPERLSPGYYKSILTWAHDYTDSIATKLFRTPGPRFLTCQEVGVHRGSCLKHSILDVRRAFPLMAKIYLPIYALPILINKRKAMIKSPLSVIKSFLKNMASSTTFLVTMATMAKLCLCILRNAHHQPPPVAGLIPLVSGTIGAWLGILWERKSRQRELALFNIFQVLGIAYAAYNKSSLGVGIPQGFTIAFSASMMVIMHAYETNPDYLNSITKAGLRFLVGARDIDAKTCKNSDAVNVRQTKR